MMRALATAACLLAAACTNAPPFPPAPEGAGGGTSTSADGGGVSVGGATSTAAGGTGGGGAAPSGVPMFVAQGGVGRTTISCDDGRTWVADRAWDGEGDPLLCGMQQQAVCYDATCSYMVDGACEQMNCCDHAPDVAKGVVWGDGGFVATWGWGRPGEVRRSANGIDWQPVLPNATYGGVAYGGGRYVVASREPYLSDDGNAWSPSQEADFRNDDGTIMWSVRRFAYADVHGGRFVALASGNGSTDMLISSDGGQGWWRPSAFPAGCAEGLGVYGGIVAGNDVIAIVGPDGMACRSSDGGDTWATSPTGLAQVLSHGVWTGSEFAFWGDDAVMITSSDGETWSHSPMATPLRLGPVARSDSGTLVALSSVWTGYEQQQFYRSEDGITWEALPDGAFEKSHPIFYIAFGHGESSAACPAANLI